MKRVGEVNRVINEANRFAEEREATNLEKTRQDVESVFWRRPVVK
jgi:hypothetical protein